jgi:tRNA-2-methylthio-N6-dimethylallyladenosine synthase
MNRKYNSEDYLRLVDLARNKIPDLSLTTDLIVSFPGETEEDFHKTLKMVERIEFDSAFMFKYSPREGTKAFLLEDDVPEEEKINRLQTLIELQKNIARKKNQELVGKTEEVLIDGKSKRDINRWKGKGRSNKTVIISKEKRDRNHGDIREFQFPNEPDKDLLGEIVKVRITEADSFTLFGEIM